MTPLLHPFSKEDIAAAFPEKEQESSLKQISWGNARTVKAIVEQRGDSKAWTLPRAEMGKLKPVKLDAYDIEIIRARKLNGNNFKLCKPYVLAGLKNAETAKAVDMSLSFVERYSKPIKDANAQRFNHSPTEKKGRVHRI